MYGRRSREPAGALHCVPGPDIEGQRLEHKVAEKELAAAGISA